MCTHGSGWVELQIKYPQEENDIQIYRIIWVVEYFFFSFSVNQFKKFISGIFYLCSVRTVPVLFRTTSNRPEWGKTIVTVSPQKISHKHKKWVKEKAKKFFHMNAFVEAKTLDWFQHTLHRWSFGIVSVERTRVVLVFGILVD